ncbi:hypothetical protein BC937DRAFT_88221 [Endogone sp. FLAS-F59071]|nr:hypothetical protein BC937DRAFT_88221 [Endogone sp. FLAS-F59071]|eukprot:RUS18878.1 hypothetical protein BC937DRAFT_88221 [Endogone sp. FLAS-F59071]
MGSVASKQVARKFPQTARPETLAAAAPTASPSTMAGLEQRASEALNLDVYTLEMKTDFIEEDSKDPHLDRKLAELGPVAVSDVTTEFRRSDPMSLILQSRRSTPTPNTTTARPLLTASDLHGLLENRKLQSDTPGAPSPALVTALSKHYGVDAELLQIVLQRLNTYTPTGKGEGRRIGVWVEDRAGIARLKEAESKEGKEAEEKIKKNELKELITEGPL